MLVLARHLNQEITIGDDIRIVVKEIHRGYVRLAIEAPPGVLILRGELDLSLEAKARIKEQLLTKS